MSHNVLHWVPPQAEPRSSSLATAPSGTISDVLAWVGDDAQRARAALEAEQAGTQRSTLIAQLERIATS
jgi:hypothetical protein